MTVEELLKIAALVQENHPRDSYAMQLANGVAVLLTIVADTSTLVASGDNEHGAFIEIVGDRFSVDDAHAIAVAVLREVF